jgi:tape measure domain-containing protein
MIVGDMEIRLRADIARLQRDMDQARQVVNTTAGAVSRAADLMKGALAAIGIGAGISEIIRMSDQYTKFTAQLRLATQSQREYVAAYGDVKRIANSAQQDLGATGALYARIANGTRELGISQKQVADITETVNLSLKVSGATAAESASAQLQLSQAFASGTLRGEEFNAVNEAAPRLMKALADGLGVPIGALKEMASNGEITSKVMAEVLPKALQQVREESKHIETIGGAFTVLKNNVMEFTGVQAQANGTVAVLTTGIGLLADNLRLVAGVLATLGAVKLATNLAEWTKNTYERIAAAQAEVAALNASRTANIAAAEAELAHTTARIAQTQAARAGLTITQENVVLTLRQANANIASAEAAVAAASAAGAQSFALRVLRDATKELAVAETIRAAVLAESAALDRAKIAASAQIVTATAAQAAAQTALNAANSVGVASTGLATRALGLLGGPIGLVITVLGLAATAWSVWGSTSGKANAQATEATEASTAEIVAQVQKQIDVLERRNALAAKGIPTTKRETPADNKLAEVLAQVDKVAKGEGEFANLSLEARTDILKVLGGQYGELTAVVERYNAAVAAGVGGTPEAKALVAVRERLTGVNQQYLKDLKTLQDARAVGAVGEKEYIALASQLATETWKSSDAGKAAVGAANKETEAYGTLITSIREAIETNKLELVTGENATASQKARAKLDQELASGKLKLSAGHLAVARAALDEQAATEQLLKTQQIEKDISKFREQGIEASLAATGALEIEAATYGKVSDARDIANVALKVNVDLEKFLDTQREAGKALSDEQIDQLRAEAKVRTQVEQATLAQSKAYGYATQLATENKRFAAEYILDEKARAAALLAIDADTWQQRIALTAEGSDARKKLEGEYATWYANQLAKPELDKHKQFWESIDRTAHDTFVSIMDGSKDTATRLRDTFKNIFFDWLYQMTLKKWIFNVGSSFSPGDVASGVAGGIGGAASGAGSAFSAFSSVSNLYSAGKTIYSGFQSGIAGSLGTGISSIGSMVGSESLYGFGAGMQGANSLAGSTALSMGTSGASAGASAAAAIPIIGWIIAGMSAANGFRKEGFDPNNGTTNALGQMVGAVPLLLNKGLQSLGVGSSLANILTGASINTKLFGRANPVAERQGMQGTITAGGVNAENYADILEKGGWFRSDKRYTKTAAIDQGTDATFDSTIQAMAATIKGFGQAMGIEAAQIDSYSKSFKLEFTSDDAKNQELVAKLFSDVGDEMANNLVPNLAAFAVKGEAASTTLQRVAGDFLVVQGALDALGVTSQQAFGAVGVASLAAREKLLKFAGGADALVAGVNYFTQNFLSAAEQLAPVQKQVTEQLAALGYSQLKTVDGYKKAVLDLASSGKLATESGAQTYAALLALAPAFKTVTDATNEAQRDMLAQRADLQKQLNDLTKTSTELLADQRAALDISNRALFDQVQAVKAAKDALSSAYQRERGEIAATTDRMAAYATSLSNFRSGLTLGSLSTLSPEQKYAEAAAQFKQTLAEARSGDATAQGKIESVATAFLTASQMANASDSKYQNDFSMVQQAMGDMQNAAAAQVDVGQASLAALDKQVSGLLDINASINAGTLSVTQAINAWRLAGGPILASSAHIDGSHAGGLARVPFDGYIAELHKGEQVLTANDAINYRSMGRLDMAPLVAEVKALRAEVSALRADNERQAGQTAAVTLAAAERNGDKVAASNVEAARAATWAQQQQSKTVIA